MTTQTKMKIGYDSITKLYTFLNGDFLYNGKSTKDPLRANTYNTLITTSEKPITIEKSTSIKKLIGYQNEKDNTIISQDEYDNLLEGINKEWNDDENEWEFGNIEDEIKYNIICKSYTPKYEYETQLTQIEFEIIEYPASQYDEIIPLYSLDAKNIFETKCTFTPNLFKTFREICEREYGIEAKNIENATHSGIRYIKINNEYIQGMDDFNMRYNKSIIDSYDGCIERMDTLKKDLNNILSFHFAKKSQKILDTTTLGGFLTELDSIRNTIYKLEIKTKSYGDYQNACGKINKLINLIIEKN